MAVGTLEAQNPKHRPWDPSAPNSIETLQVVYKIAERCNLNCSYCYYYNLGDKTALSRPARASQDTTQKLAGWLATGARELRIPRIHISFHGGEPMLMRASSFARACAAFRRLIEPVAEVRFSIQTNGTLFTEGWMEALRRFDVSVGISIDGMRADHDRHRLDHQGRSSFDATEAAIRRLVDEERDHPHLAPGTISVVDHRGDYVAIYRYLRKLGVRTMHFLLPDRTADDRSPQVDREAATIGASLNALFREWLTEDDPTVDIRFVRPMMRALTLAGKAGPVRKRRKEVQILVVRSDGTVAVDDSLIPALDWYSAAPEHDISERSLRSVFSDPIFTTMEAETARLPTGCRDCRWAELCRGGDLENRFSNDSGFDNPSVYCETYKALYEGMCRAMLSRGYPPEEMAARFAGFDHA